MRAGSTLLLHLLSSHPEILGAGERLATYASQDDLHRLAADVAYRRRRPFQAPRFVVDQINHTHHVTSLELLNHPQVYKIILIREPRPTLASMVDVLGPLGYTRKEAIAYYLERVSTLASYGTQVLDRATVFFLTYEDLVRRPHSVLPRLESWLGLQGSLHERYRVFDFTGSRGDPSPHIRSGRIRTNLPQRSIDLEQEVLTRVNDVFRESRNSLDDLYGSLSDRSDDASRPQHSR